MSNRPGRAPWPTRGRETTGRQFVATCVLGGLLAWLYCRRQRKYGLPCSRAWLGICVLLFGLPAYVGYLDPSPLAGQAGVSALRPAGPARSAGLCGLRPAVPPRRPRRGDRKSSHEARGCGTAGADCRNRNRSWHNTSPQSASEGGTTADRGVASPRLHSRASVSTGT